MTEIEKLIPSVVKPCHPHGSQPYENWVVEQEKVDHGRDNLTCLEHLRFYNNSLMINNEIRWEDAMRYLQGNMQSKHSTEVEVKLEGLFNEAVKVIEKDLEATEPNPGLQILEKRLLEKFSGNACGDDKSKGIIFVRTRFVAEALVSWLENSQPLQEFVKNPTSVIGCGQRNGKGNSA
jgi:hypothetical protein